MCINCALLWMTYFNAAKEEVLEERSLLTSSEAVDALFATTCHIIRDTTTDAIRKFCDFTGELGSFMNLSHLFVD